MAFDRRKFLALGLTIPAVTLVTKAARAAECVDLDELSDNIASMRESLEYMDSAADPAQTCSGCEYFKPVQPDDTCGPCNVLTSPVSARGHCVSWTKRSA